MVARPASMVANGSGQYNWLELILRRFVATLIYPATEAYGSPVRVHDEFGRPIYTSPIALLDPFASASHDGNLRFASRRESFLPGIERCKMAARGANCRANVATLAE